MSLQKEIRDIRSSHVEIRSDLDSLSIRAPEPPEPKSPPRIHQFTMPTFTQDDCLSAPDVLQAAIPDTPTDNNKPLSAPSSWMRPNPFSGGYSNAIPFLEEFTQITTPLLQQSQPIIIPSNSVTVFIDTLVTILAQSVNCVTYPFVLFAAIQLSTPVIGAVPRNYFLKETPFQSTGPGPPPGVSSQNFFLNYFLDFKIF